jgi:hypothetical protein
MSDENGVLFFAPEIPFFSLDPNSEEIVDHFKARIEGYYLKPSEMLCRRIPFAAGVLLVSCADALARYDPRVPPEKKTNTDRYAWWIKNNLPSFQTNGLAKRFYQEFRCGLVHEARVKKGSAFTDADKGKTVWIEGDFIFVNPCYLLDELSGALVAFCRYLHDVPAARGWFQTELTADFDADLSK